MNKRRLMHAVFGDEYLFSATDADGRPQKKVYVPSDKTLTGALDRLTEREKYVIECRFANSRLTLRQTATDYPRKDGGKGCSQGRVGQIEAKALRRLRLHNKLTNLWPGRGR